MKIERKGILGKDKVVEYTMDISDELEIEDKEKKAICTGVYDIKDEYLFEKDKKILVVIDLPNDTTALFELKLFDKMKKDEDSIKLSEDKDSIKLSGSKDEVQFRRLGTHLYDYQFLDVF